MSARAWLWPSLLLNFGFLVLLVRERALVSPKATAPLRSSEAQAPATPRTNVVVRRINFTWDELESTNFKAYIANLRRIGCPEPTVRDLIVAEVDALFDRRRATEVVTPEQQWWRADADPLVAAAAHRQLEALELERRQVLNELLGPGWDSPALAAQIRFNLLLDGPVLGQLPLETKQQLRRIEIEALRKRQDLQNRRRAEGADLSPADTRALERESKVQLAKVLTVEQLEEYRLRYSETGRVLRDETRGLGLSPEEFRKVFRIRDDLDEAMLALGNEPGAGSGSRTRRLELEQRRDQALQAALGERYAHYVLVQDPLFQRAQSLAEETGAAPESVLPLYQLHLAIEEERHRIRNDAALSSEQRAVALERVAIDREEMFRKILGDDEYELYRAARLP